MQMDIPATLHKLRQITGHPKRFGRRHNRADAERILQKHLDAAKLAAVYEGDE